MVCKLKAAAHEILLSIYSKFTYAFRSNKQKIKKRLISKVMCVVLFSLLKEINNLISKEMSNFIFFKIKFEEEKSI